MNSFHAFDAACIDAIKNAQTVYIFPHISPDADAISSGYSLKLILEGMGKAARVVTEEAEQIASYNIVYRGNEDEAETGAELRDLSIAVDCADIKRLGKRAELFLSSAVTINIDHHGTNTRYAQHNAVDANAAATTEMIYYLSHLLDQPLTKELAHNIYIGIVADTGSFRYSNTTCQTHKITAELMELGIDAAEICNLIFSSKPMRQLLLQSILINNLSLHCGGKIAVCVLTKDEIESVGATEEDAGEMAYIPRSVNGVELSVYLRERGDPKYVKASMRSKHYVDVSAIAAKFGGGGHKRAAGCEFYIPIDEAKELLLAESSFAVCNPNVVK